VSEDATLSVDTFILILAKCRPHIYGLEMKNVLYCFCTVRERVEEFKYLGTTLTNQNSIPEEIRSRVRSGNACYHSVQNLLSSRFL